MVNVRDKTCRENGCKKIPHFNIEKKSKGLYCYTHKKDGMINVNNKRCIEDGCKIISYYRRTISWIVLFCT